MLNKLKPLTEYFEDAALFGIEMVEYSTNDKKKAEEAIKKAQAVGYKLVKREKPLLSNKIKLTFKK